MLEKKSIRTPIPAKKQKLDKAGREEVHPRKKAQAFVNEVIVIEVPAWIMPCFILFSTESVGLL